MIIYVFKDEIVRKMQMYKSRADVSEMFYWYTLGLFSRIGALFDDFLVPCPFSFGFQVVISTE